MTLRVLLAAAVPLLATATANAQAPGQWSAPPPSAGSAVVVVAEPRPASRWSIGLGVGGTEIGTEDDSEQVSFSGVNIAVRYRAWKHLELELLLGGGAEDTESLETSSREELALGYGFLSARYRFNPHDKWNYWLLAGLGALTVAPKSATDDQLEAAQRAAFTFGGGIEYRLRRLAFQAEIRGVAASATEDEMEFDSEAEGLGGGQVTLGANFYF